MNKNLSKILILFVVLGITFSVPFSRANAETTTQVTSQVAESTTQVSDDNKKEEVQKTLEEQKKDLQKRIKDSEKKLKELEKDSKETQEYIDALDEQIGLMNQQLDVLDKRVQEAEKNVKELDKKIKTLTNQLKTLQAEYDESKKEFDELNEKFNDTYNAYCKRMRALYMSGNTSKIEILLTSGSLADFFDRLEMIRVVSIADSKLLAKTDKQMKEIITKQDGLNEQKEKLTAKSNILKKDKAKRDSEKAEIEKDQDSIAEMEISLSEKRAKSDKLLSQLNEKTAMYTEYKYEDIKYTQEVEQEINDLLSGLKTPDEISIIDTQHKYSGSGGSSNSSTLYSESDAVYNLLYPVPGHYSVSCGFGYYSSGKPHSGTDYPCPTGSKVVAAQKGIVVKVRKLNYSYGRYVMIYHGTDKKGRKIVTLYAHNSQLLVHVGQEVSRGQQIARSGSTGNSTGPHCHFELIIDGTKVNSKNYTSKK